MAWKLGSTDKGYVIEGEEGGELVASYIMGKLKEKKNPTPVFKQQIADGVSMSMWEDQKTKELCMKFEFPPLPVIANPANLNHLMNVATEQAVRKLADLFVEQNADALMSNIDPVRLTSLLEKEIARRTAELSAESGEGEDSEDD